MIFFFFLIYQAVARLNYPRVLISRVRDGNSEND